MSDTPSALRVLAGEFNNFNAVVGTYCTRCARNRLKQSESKGGSR